MGGFAVLGEPLASVLRSAGYKKPTPIQEKAFPLVLSGNNVLIVAPTGSGKTEAAMLPVLSKLSGARSEGKIKAIYVTPLRSLNRDIFRRLEWLGEQVGVKIYLRHGDSSVGEKRRFLRDPPHVMITTPESLYFLLSVPAFREALNELRYIIVDEVHEIFASKRGAELSLTLERIDKLYTRNRVQVIGLSATVRKPHVFGKRLFSWRHFVVVEDVSSKALRIHVDGAKTAEKVYELIANYVAKSSGRVLVFTNTRDTAEIVGAHLKKILGDDIVEVHHGSLSRDIRLMVEEEFKTGKVRVVVATSSLELGIDIGDVDLVVQYMSPRQVVKLVQRVGRAGHGYGKAAHGVIVAMPNTFDILESTVIAARASRGNLEDLPFYHKSYDALIHQVAGMLVEQGTLSLSDIYRLVTRSSYYSDLGIEELEEVIGFMEQLRLVKVRGNRLHPAARLRSYYFSTTMIPDTKQYVVIDIESSRKIGTLDEEFVATLNKGEIFVLSGESWEVVDIDDSLVRVRRSKRERLLPPAWEGDLIPVERNVAREVGSLLRRLRRDCNVLKEYPVSEDLANHVCEVIRSLDSDMIPGDDVVIVEHYRDTILIYSFLGSRGNMALEYLLAGVIEEVAGYPPETTSTPYVVAVRLPSSHAKVAIWNILHILKELDDKEIENIVFKSLQRSRVYKWILLHVARRAGAVSSEAKMSEIRRILPSLRQTLLGKEALKEALTKKIDIEALIRFIDELRSGRRRVLVRKKEGFSKLALEAIGESRIPERLRAETIPPAVLAEIIKRKIGAKKIALVCMRCGTVKRTTIGSLENEPRCETCGSGLLAPVYSEDEASSLRILVLKLRRRKPLTKEEKRMLQKHIESANLVLDYGKKAVEALTYTGVGPATARSVLRRLIFGEQQFYAALAEAEARYHRYKYKFR